MEPSDPPLRYVVVGYQPTSGDDTKDGSVILFHGPASRNFEALIRAGYTVPDRSAGQLEWDLISDKVLDPNT